MDELRKNALVLYGSLPVSDKEKAEALFKSWDKNGDYKIDLKEYFYKLDQKGITDIAGNDLFRKLDTNGDGKLDFAEFLTLYYILESNRFVFCDKCSVFLEGGYYTCVECFNDSTADSFDICSSCRENNAFTHHHAYFVDNYSMLHRIKTSQQAFLPQSHESKRTRVKKRAKRCAKAMIEVAAVAPGVYGLFQSCFGSQ